MNQDPLNRILWFVATWMGATLLLVGLAALLTTYSPKFNRLERQIREVVGEHALFVMVNVGVSVGLFLLALACSLLGGLFEWDAVRKFGDTCYGLGLFSCLGFLWLLKLKSEADDERRVKEALFSPRTMEVKFGDISGSAVSVGNTGAVHQSVRVDSLTLHKQIHSLIEAVPESGKELTEPQKRAAIDNLNVLADQTMRPAAQREPSKIETALKLLPGILSSAAALAKAWEALEPLIKAHLQ